MTEAQVLVSGELVDFAQVTFCWFMGSVNPDAMCQDKYCLQVFLVHGYPLTYSSDPPTV